MTGIARETLALRRGGIAPPFSLLMPTSAFPRAPATVAGRIQRTRNAPLPILLGANNGANLSRAFGACLIPDYYPRPDPRPVSCYALFE